MEESSDLQNCLQELQACKDDIRFLKSLNSELESQIEFLSSQIKSTKMQWSDYSLSHQYKNHKYWILQATAFSKWHPLKNHKSYKKGGSFSLVKKNCREWKEVNHNVWRDNFKITLLLIIYIMKQKDKSPARKDSFCHRSVFCSQPHYKIQKK